MNLTAEQIAARQGKLTASRVAALMKGDREGILRLYREMIGEETEEDLGDVWAVQLGSTTEKLNLDWYEKKSGNLLTDRGAVIGTCDHEWAAATLDGWDTVLKCPVECKHVGGREPLEVIIDRYQPQMQWQMMVTGGVQCALSVIMGANEPIVEYIDRNDPYIEEMLHRAEYFMMCVDLRKPPVTLDPIAPPVEPTKVINMTGNNVWADQAVEWLATKDAAVKAKDAEKVLKSIMPAEAVRAFGNGIRITRDRAGRLSLRSDE